MGGVGKLWADRGHALRVTTPLPVVTAGQVGRAAGVRTGRVGVLRSEYPWTARWARRWIPCGVRRVPAIWGGSAGVVLCSPAAIGVALDETPRDASVARRARESS